MLFQFPARDIQHNYAVAFAGRAQGRRAQCSQPAGQNRRRNNGGRCHVTDRCKTLDTAPGCAPYPRRRPATSFREFSAFRLSCDTLIFCRRIQRLTCLARLHYPVRLIVFASMPYSKNTPMLRPPKVGSGLPGFIFLNFWFTRNIFISHPLPYFRRHARQSA